jgi:hypothetical protein
MKVHLHVVILVMKFPSKYNILIRILFVNKTNFY